jgi:surface protein
MDTYLNLMPDLRDIVASYFGDVIFVGFYNFSQGGGEVTFATAEEFRESYATHCHFINYEITSTNHENNRDIPKSLMQCSGVPRIKTHTLANMFWASQCNGDLSQWDVSNVTDMSGMFFSSSFNGDLSQWDVSSVTDMKRMFHESRFNGDISQWDVSSVTDMKRMFHESQFNGDLSQWDVSSVLNMDSMFLDSEIKKETVQTWNNFKTHDINKMFE